VPGKIHVPVSFALDGLDAVQRKLGNIGRTAGRVGIAVAAAAGAIGGKFALNAVEGSRDLERNLEGLATVFKGSTDQMVAFSESAYTMGLSLSEAAKSATFIGSVLKQSGFSIEQTADLTEDLVSLGADLALTYGYDVQEALLGMTALFRGEYDPIEKFGVAMKQSEIDAEKLARGLGSLTGAEERFADQQIRVEFLMDRASDALGAVGRQQNNLSVQQNALNASFNNMRDTVAVGLLPVLSHLTKQLSDGLMRATPAVRDAFDSLAVPLERIGQVAVEFVEPAIVALAGAIEDVGNFLTVVTNPTTVWGEKLLGLWINTQLLGDQIKELSFKIFGNIDAMEVFAATLNVVVSIIDFAIVAFQNIGIFLEEVLPNGWNLFAAAAELAMARVINVLDLFDQDHINVELARAEFAYDNLTKRIGRNIDARILANNVSREAAKVMAQEEFAAFKLERSLSRLPTSSRIEILEEELRDLKRFKAPQEAIDAVNAELKKLLGIKDDDGGGDDGGSGETVKDFVAEFYQKLTDEVKKQSAKLDLEGFGLTEALIAQVLNSQGWEEIFKDIVEGGQEAALKLQEAFNVTAAGLSEIAKLEEERLEREAEINVLLEEQVKLQEELAIEIEEATEAYADFLAITLEVVNSVDALNTYESEIGRFQNRTQGDLARIEQQINNAFDNGYLLEDAKKNLLDYARTELTALSNLQRKRDELLSQRNNAADAIFGVADAVASTGNLINLLGNIEDKVSKVEVSEVFEDIVKTAGSLEGFRVTMTRNFTDVITETVDKSAQLTSNFQNMIDRTKLFIENLIELRKLGLDPFLFQQLVDAGMEAGGATAQALVEGGVDTVNEVNALTRELEALGVQLGEETYEVTKDTGERFISGIVDGMDSELGELEAEAKKAAEVFSEAFAASMADAMEDAFSSILDEIKATFEALMAELDRQKRLLGEYDTISPTTTIHGNTVVSTMPIVSTGVPSYSISTTPIDYPTRPLDFGGGGIGYMSTPTGMSGGNNIQMTVYADNRLGGAAAGEEVINALKTWQTSNGDYQVSLSGFGS
tara:strand:+ start:9844 stop:12999 length:3156 start_codon:yes stop_codon:yes gene_type:complete